MLTETSSQHMVFLHTFLMFSSKISEISELWLAVDFHSMIFLLNEEIGFSFNTTGAIMCCAAFA